MTIELRHADPYHFYADLGPERVMMQTRIYRLNQCCGAGAGGAKII